MDTRDLEEEERIRRRRAMIARRKKEKRKRERRLKIIRTALFFGVPAILIIALVVVRFPQREGEEAGKRRAERNC